MRAGALSCYGNAAVETPNYDRLAESGTVFENNYTTHPVCVASRCSLMTGWYPHVAGFRTLKHVLQPWHPNFLRSLHDAGFETHVYGKNHVFSEEVYFDCVDKYLFADFGHGNTRHCRGNVPGAEELEEDDAEEKKSDEAPRKFPDYTMLLDPLPDEALESIGDTRCVRAAVNAIRGWKEGDKPLFIFLPLLFPHAPYCITERFQKLYDPSKLPPVLPKDLAGKPMAHRLIRQYRELGDKDELVFQKVQAVYLGMCSYVDMLLGRVLDALEETGLDKDTTVVASSDHGDWAGDWGLVEKWPNCMDDDLTKVPLLIRRPGGARGHRVGELTQTFDVFPTILDWEGVPIRHDQFGVSLREQVQGAPGNPQRRVYCEGGYDQREPHCFEGTKGFLQFAEPGNLYYPKMIQQQERPESVCRTAMLRDSRWKLVVRTNGEQELYDMEQDPRELRNLYGLPEYRETARRLEQELLRWFLHTSDVVPWEGHDR